ncbi:MAG: YHYH protein [Reichenbachiella sp.]
MNYPNIAYKFTSLLLLVTFISFSCSSDEADDMMPNETPEAGPYDITTILSKFNSNGMSYEVNGNTVTFHTNDLPDHKSPYYLGTQWEDDLYEEYNGDNTLFNLNPNRIAEQDFTLTIPLNPEEAAVHSLTALGPMGIARNGVVFFNQYAAGNSPLTGEINSFDQYLGHPAQIGNYHYHIEPNYLTEQFGKDAFLGLLADGFPVYGPIEDGQTITNADLDDYHGHISATTDFPDGIYHYHITSEDPYINGNGYFGTPGNITQ